MTDDPSGETQGPNLRKDDAPAARPQQPASIWERLDGAPEHAAPQIPSDPRVGAWGQPHDSGVTPQAAAAAYTAAAPADAGDRAGVFTLAGWGARFGAYLIDSLLFGIVTSILAIAICLHYGMTLEESTRFLSTLQMPDTIVDTTPLYLTVVGQRLLIGLITAWFLAAWEGQTPGKRALGIKVMRADGQPMNFAVAMRREFLGRSVVLTILGGLSFGIAAVLNYLWPLWDPQRRTGYDALADTRVVTAPKN
jgi:uncharacterized RDD family membrane protein YckC